MLVVLAVIAVLLALLLPAVQKIRASAARLQCANQLRQIGLALHHFHDDHSHFPAGFTDVAGDAQYPYMPWQVRVLPYLEQAALYQLSRNIWKGLPYPYANPPHFGLGVRVAIYSCPSDPLTAEVGQSAKYGQVGLCDYLGVSGTDHTQTDGILYLNAKTSINDISDGTSQTLLVGERPPSADANYGWWYTGNGLASTGNADVTLGTAERFVPLKYVSGCAPGPHRFGPGQRQPCDLLHFWSWHEGGAHFCRADGSVELLRYSAAPRLPALGTRAGGENLDERP
jgi:hypothetical protein